MHPLNKNKKAINHCINVMQSKCDMKFVDVGPAGFLHNGDYSARFTGDKWTFTSTMAQTSAPDSEGGRTTFQPQG